MFVSLSSDELKAKISNFTKQTVLAADGKCVCYRVMSRRTGARQRGENE